MSSTPAPKHTLSLQTGRSDYIIELFEEKTGWKFAVTDVTLAPHKPLRGPEAKYSTRQEATLAACKSILENAF